MCVKCLSDQQCVSPTNQIEFYIVCDSAPTADKIISDVPLFYHAEFKNHEENIFFYFFTSKRITSFITGNLRFLGIVCYMYQNKI